MERSGVRGRDVIKDFIKYIYYNIEDEKRREDVVKKSLQIAIVLQKGRNKKGERTDRDLLDTLINLTFEEGIDKEKIKKFIETISNTSTSRLRGVYLEALR